MAALSLSIAIEWEERPGDCQPCKVCKEPIYLKKYVPVIIVGTKKADGDIGLCESCYNCIDNGDAI